MGVGPELATQPYPLNRRILMGFFILALSTVCILEFVFCEEFTFSEFAESSYMGSYMATLFFALLIIVVNVKEIFELMIDCENIVNTSKDNEYNSQPFNIPTFFLIKTLISALKYSASKSIFRRANQLAEKLNKIIFIVLVKLTPACGAGPWVAWTFFIYFTTDLGADAFQLPFPMW